MTVLARRVLITGLAVITLVAASPAGACERQVVRGRVSVPMGPTHVGPVAALACGMTDATVQFIARANGLVAFRFDVDPASRGHWFELSADLPAVLEITFWGGNGNETFTRTGVVPQGARSAYVCLVAGPPTGFTYEVTT